MHTLFIIVLALTSVIALTFIVERGLALRWNRVLPAQVRHAVEFYKTSDQLPQLRQACEQNPSTLSRLLLFASQHLEWTRSETSQLLETRARHAQIQDRGVNALPASHLQCACAISGQQ